MKVFVVIATLLLAFIGPSWADGSETFPFRVGEKLTYQIFWGPFVAGRATLEVQDIEPVGGHDCYHLIARAWTSGLADLLFHVDSTTESWLDVDQLFSRRYLENRVEGKRTRSNETIYDYDHHTTINTNLVNGRATCQELDQPVQDVVSSLYYVRVLRLKPDVANKFVINADGANYVMNVTPDLRKSLWVRPLGDVEALRIEPQPTLNIVAANHGRMWFWLSDDNLKMPLLVSTDMKIGTARLVLYKIEAETPVASDTANPGFTPDQSESGPDNTEAGTAGENTR
jgi:hypothetical protein